jgi:NAD+ synthase (glutamine-hydrolysing)
MKIALAQFNPRVGDFLGNFAALKSSYEWACNENADILLSPELSLVGYLPLDLLDRPEIFSRSLESLEKVKSLTKGFKSAIAVGWVRETPQATGRAAQNVISVVKDGEVVFTQAKTLLPTYDVFDEARYFEPAVDQAFWLAPSGERIIFAICEDLWGADPLQKRALYGKNPVDHYESLKANLLISLSASPYEFNKQTHREELHGAIAERLKIPFLYLNQTGATDELLYDGASFSLDAKGKVTSRLPSFQSVHALFDFNGGELKEVKRLSASPESLKDSLIPQADPMDVLLDGLITGIRDYFRKTGFSRALLGLSGGIDSAVVAVLAVQALGKENVHGVAMPSQYSSGHSLEDAEGLARNLGIPFEVRPIKFLFSTAARDIAGIGGAPLKGLTEENLQSRLRALILMTLSNQENALVLTTGNKSEMAMGYCTLYGDMCGALAPIGDLLKTRVYALARHLNQRYGEVIPLRSIEKAPSAELRPNQTDQDSLPPYPELDDFLEKYLEKGVPVKDLLAQYPFAREVLKKLEWSEYKRKQAAPVLKVSSKAFGVGRRVPIAKIWDQSV